MGQQTSVWPTTLMTKNEESKRKAMKALQLTQNRMLRAINGTRIKDQVSIKLMLDKFNLLSVNQLAAQIKLTEVWKAANGEGYAISLYPYRPIRSGQDADITHDLRPRTN